MRPATSATGAGAGVVSSLHGLSGISGRALFAESTQHEKHGIGIMGRRLIVEAIHATRMTPVSHLAFRVLVVMAEYARDEATAGTVEHRYFGGWRTIAIGLGYDVTDGPLPARAKQSVARAIRELVDAKLIRVAPGNEQRGRKRCYVITV